MGKKAAIAFMILALSTIRSAHVSDPWKRATYHGLVLGKTTEKQLIAALGQPKARAREEETRTPLLYFDTTDPFPGTLQVWVINHVVNSISLAPAKPLSKDELIKRFGPNYRVVSYAFDECLSKGGIAPVYESPNGSIAYLEY